MNIFIIKNRTKITILIISIILGVLSLFYTNKLVNELKQEEQKKVALWAKATQMLINEENTTPLTLDVLKNNTTVPVILTDANDSILHYRNINVPKKHPIKFLQKQLEEMRKSGKVIAINLGNNETQHLYYKASTLLTKLTWFPIIQLLVGAIFVFVAYLAFSSTRRAEENRVWVGMAKETAHQLGTPLSSMLGWIDLFEMNNPESEGINEMKGDINRLKNIADRFSKIGSEPKLSRINLTEIIEKTVKYFETRTSKKLNFIIDIPNEIIIDGNKVLIQWVFENMIKNSIDAMEGRGKIIINAALENNMYYIDITDNGKGINKSKFKTIFQPGYTTKKRGWGLGLSLAKRIITRYHKGKIIVSESESYKKTTFRISLSKAL